MNPFIRYIGLNGLTEQQASQFGLSLEQRIAVVCLELRHLALNPAMDAEWRAMAKGQAPLQFFNYARWASLVASTVVPENHPRYAEVQSLVAENLQSSRYRHAVRDFRRTSGPRRFAAAKRMHKLVTGFASTLDWPKLPPKQCSLRGEALEDYKRRYAACLEEREKKEAAWRELRSLREAAVQRGLNTLAISWHDYVEQMALLIWPTTSKVTA